VGSEESDPRSNRISSSSPVGQALLNKTVGDEVHVKVPRGVRHLKVVSISVTG
jgi:transcription elongation factor GreA